MVLAKNSSARYCGRFAPSPTGALHFGSLVAALGSYLDAKAQGGSWLIRMEDLDAPRCSPQAAADILATLTRFGLHSDEPVLYQHSRTATYAAALQQLQRKHLLYACSCTRKEIADSAVLGSDGFVYPGTCSTKNSIKTECYAWRVKISGVIGFDDGLQGSIRQNLAQEVGDFVLQRADGLFTYQLAVVVDDAFQQVTHVVRGADLLASTPRQIYLQNLLDLPTPRYLHLPLALNSAGEKLSKQTLASTICGKNPVPILLQALDFLQQSPPDTLAGSSVQQVLDWAIAHWQTAPLFGRTALVVADEFAQSGQERKQNNAQNQHG